MWHRLRISHHSGFTLVELAVVLSVIALVIGGIILGQDLLDVARARAQASQLENYNAAIATFQSKYGTLPGDVRAVDAAELALVARSGERGRGDGNGMIESCEASCTGLCMILPLGCEVALFWADMAKMGMMDGTFASAEDDYVQASAYVDTLGYFPQASFGGVTLHPTTCARTDLWLVAIRITASSLTGFGGSVTQYPGVRSTDAYRLDAKVDDALADSGRVRVFTVGGSNVQGYYCRAVTPPTSCVDATGQYDVGSDAGTCQINIRATIH